MFTYVGNRACYSFQYEIPLLFLTNIRSSNTLLYALVVILTSKITGLSREFKKRDYFKAVLVTASVILFAVGKSSNKDSSSIKLSSLFLCILSIVVESSGGVMLQVFKKANSKAQGQELITATIILTLLAATVHRSVP